MMSAVCPRLLFVAHTAEMNGPSNSLLHLLKNLRGQYEASVVLPETGKLVEKLSEVGVPTFVERHHRLRARSIPHLLKLIRAEKIDLVYGNNHSGACRNALIATRFARRPFIWHVRGCLHPPFGARHSVHFFRFAHALVAVSKSSADSFSGFVDNRRVQVVFNGIPVESFGNSRNSTTWQRPVHPGSNSEPLTFINVASVDRRKPQEYLIDSMQSVTQQFPASRLLLVGRLDRDPQYVAEIQRRVRSLDLDSCISFLGFRDDIPELLGTADVYVHAAMTEGFGVSVVEAMASKLPVVAFATEGVRETVINGETGFLVPQKSSEALAQKMIMLSKDRDLRLRMGDAGRKRVKENFTDDVMAVRIHHIIQSVMNR